MKMKKISFFCAASLAMLSLTGCSDEIEYDTGEGEGRILLGAILNNDTKVTARAAEPDAELASNTIIWISNSKGVVRKYNGVGEIPASGIKLLCDNYVAEAWAGDSVPASFDKKWFKGREAFTVRRGEIMQVDVECKIANVVVEVRYDEQLHNAFESLSLTAGHKAGSLTFEGREDEGRPGYFMMPSFDKDIAYTMTGVLADGTEKTVSSVIVNAKPGTKYVLRVKYNPEGTPDIGAGLFSIDVDETEILVEDKIDIVSAPVITGLNFMIDKPQTGEAGQWTERKVWIQSTSPLKSVEVDYSTFNDNLGIRPMFEIFGMDPSFVATLESKGFTFVHHTHENEDNSGFEEMKLVFGAEFLNVIPEGEHPIKITVTDENNRTSSATIDILITNAPVRTEEISNPAAVWATKVTLSGTVLKDGDSGFGFDYRPAGTQQWEHVDADVAARAIAVGSTFTCEISGLTPGTEYEYRAVSAGFSETTVRTFTTEGAQQLKNAGFEDWTKPAKPWLPYADEADMFWDSGNHGSSTMNKNVTIPSEDKKHSGRYSAKLESQFVGVAMLGKFAAGNLFAGKYLKTDGMDGVLGWGRPFASRPKALRGYVHYTPGTVGYTSDKAPDIVKDGPDKGIIYVAIVDGTTESYGSEKWACVVKTKASDANYFNPKGSNVIAYGEKVFDSATTGDAMIEFEIPLVYARTDAKAVNVIVVCSASKGGDYFAGAAGSVMYIDDFELVY